MKKEKQGATQGKFANLRMKQLSLVVALEHHRSIRKAADEIHVSQPAASKSLNELENTLGIRLFERDRTGLRPTEGGRCVISYAKEIVQDLRRMHFDLDRVRDGRQEILRIGSIMSAVPAFMTKCLPRLQTMRPDLTVEAEEGTTAELMPQLRDGKVDMVFSCSQHSRKGEEFEHVQLPAEDMYVVAGARHVLSEEDIYDCPRLLQYPWIAYEPSDSSSSMLQEWFGQHANSVPAVKLRTTSAFITASVLSATDWLALLPCSAFGLIGAQGCIKRIQIRQPLPSGCFYVYWNRHSLRIDLVQLALGELTGERKAGMAKPMLLAN